MRPDPIRRLTALADVVLCSGIPTQVALGFLLHALGCAPIDDAGRLAFRYVIALSLGDTVLLVGTMATLMAAHGQKPSAVWLGHRRTWREILLGLAHVPLVFAVVILLLNLLQLVAPWLHN